MKSIAFKDYLKNKRIERELSQKEVSDKLGYTTPQFISNWERGLSAPPIDVFKKIASLYQISSEEMFDIFLSEEIERVRISMKDKFKCQA